MKPFKRLNVQTLQRFVIDGRLKVTANILKEIFEYKRLEIAHSRRSVPLEALIEQVQDATPALDFLGALREAPHSPALIAEVKQRSPSRGQLAQQFDPFRLVRLYSQNGARAISVLTDERYFGGSLEILQAIAALPDRPPLLRKDFICDAYQLYETRAAGADAVLLIVAGLDESKLNDLYAQSIALGLTPLVEVHTLAELEAGLKVNPDLVGINNRDLSTFEVNLETTLKLKPHVPEGILLVAESGIHSRQDVTRLAQAGVDAILVGEALVTAPDVSARVRELAGVQI
jgi:indole-3-glycerol phosphate synthase